MLMQANVFQEIARNGEKVKQAVPLQGPGVGLGSNVVCSMQYRYLNYPGFEG